MRFLRLAVPIFFGLLPLSAQAASQRFVTGNDLLTMCRAAEGPAQLLECVGYVMGVADLIVAETYDIKIPGYEELGPIRICFLGVKTGQLVDITTKYLEQNAGMRHLPAAPLVVLALIDALPRTCRTP